MMKYIIISILMFCLTGCEASSDNEIAIKEFHDVLQLERDFYIKGYLQSYQEFSSKHAGKSVMELSVRPNQMPWPDPYALIRVDMFANVDNQVKASRYEQEQPAKDFKAFQFKINSLKVDLYPFVWNRVELRSTDTPKNIQLLTDWTNKWMDIEDKNTLDKNGFTGAIHSVTYPASNNSFWYFMVDFGSSPIEAVDDLLVTLSKMGLTNITIGSFSSIEQ